MLINLMTPNQKLISHLEARTSMLKQLSRLKLNLMKPVAKALVGELYLLFHKQKLVMLY